MDTEECNDIESVENIITGQCNDISTKTEQCDGISTKTNSIREKSRNAIKLERYEKRQIKSDQLRVGLSEVKQYLDESTNLTEKDVHGLTTRIKRRKHADKKDLLRLSNAFLQSEANIIAFIKITGGLQVLVKELTGNDSEQQINAAEAICNLSLGSSFVCEKITSGAGSYLTTFLSSTNQRLRKTCLWSLQNILISGGKAFETLISMQIVKTLFNIYLSNEEDDDIVKDAGIALDIIFSNSTYNSNLIESPEILWKKIILKNESSSGSEYLLKIIFNSNIINENLSQQQVLYLLNSCIKNIHENCDLQNYCKLKTYYSIRILANLFAIYLNLEFYNLFIKIVGNTIEFFNSIFRINDNVLHKESLWMLKNFLRYYEFIPEDVNEFLINLKISK